MESVLWLVAALTCPVAMGFGLLLISHRIASHAHKPSLPEPWQYRLIDDPEKRLAVLQAEQALVEAQIRATEDD